MLDRIDTTSTSRPSPSSSFNRIGHFDSTGDLLVARVATSIRNCFFQHRQSGDWRSVLPTPPIGRLAFRSSNTANREIGVPFFQHRQSGDWRSVLPTLPIGRLAFRSSNTANREIGVPFFQHRQSGDWRSVLPTLPIGRLAFRSSNTANREIGVPFFQHRQSGDWRSVSPRALETLARGGVYQKGFGVRIADSAGIGR